MIKNYLYYLILVLVIILSFLFISSKRDGGLNDIYFISKNELLEIENNRIRKNKDQNSADLFNGKITEAFKIVYKEALERERSGQRIIFVDSKAYGKNLYSISLDIHSKILDYLDIR